MKNPNFEIKEMNEDYALVNLKDITDEARELALIWCEHYGERWIGTKHKLASDIMNYARRLSEGKIK